MTTLDSRALTRPIIGIENRTAQEVFDIMSDRFRIALSQPQAGEPVAVRGLYGPFGWLNGCRGLSEDSWELESDPLENSEEYFAIPLYALTDPFKEVGPFYASPQAANPAQGDWPKWYTVDKHGNADLCASEEDARDSVRLRTDAFPERSPFRVLSLAPLVANPAQVTDADLTARLKEIAVEVFPSANKFAVADGVKSIIRILERIDPAEYAVLHRSMYPFSYSAPTEDDGQPDDAQEWHDYDPDC